MSVERWETERALSGQKCKTFHWRFTHETSRETVEILWQAGSWVAFARQCGPRGGNVRHAMLPMVILQELIELSYDRPEIELVPATIQEWTKSKSAM